MVDKFKGIVELEIGGAKRGFKFGIRATQLFAEHFNIKFSEVSSFLKKESEEMNVESTMRFYHSAAIAYSNLFKTPEPSIDDVYAWIEEVGVDIMNERLVKISEIPNGTAPKAGQQ